MIRDILDAAVASCNSRWSWFVGSNVEFLRRALTAKHRNLLGIVTKREHNHFPKGFMNCMTATAFLNKMCSVALSSQTWESCDNVAQ